MLTAEQNELLTRTDLGTPAGDLLRRYWEPVALSEELPPGGAPLPLHVLGEELVLFRNEDGQPGLLGLHCSHRGADLSYGRLEDGGLRCIYHGWLYDTQGRCLEQPGEPAFRWTDRGGRDSPESLALTAQAGARQAGLASWRGSGSDDPLLAAGPARVYEKIRHPAYPCRETAGLILAYLGPGEPPLLPGYDMLLADGHRFVTKVYRECNYLQGNEGNIDSVHLAFLHRQFNIDVSFGSVVSRGGYDIVETEETGFGVRNYFVRKLEDGRWYLHNTAFGMPNLGFFGAGRSGGRGLCCNWHVPIDDVHHWEYVVNYQPDGPLEDNMSKDHHSELGADYRPLRMKANRYLQDREEMNGGTFAGLGRYFYAHDGCATEGAGPIQDRTQEHLGSQDAGVVAARAMLLRGIQDIQEGRDPPHVERDPAANHFPTILVRGGVIPGEADWRTHWQASAPSGAQAAAHR